MSVGSNLFPEFHSPGTYVAICVREKSAAERYVVSKTFFFDGAEDESAHGFAERALGFKGLAFVIPAHILGNKCLKTLAGNAINKDSTTA
jgi:hypothetical protein